nr:type II secretion system F family protein [Nocardioides thalensis]
MRGVTATLDGDALEATAEHAGTGAVVQRTAVLAIDTSSSMRKAGRFEAAKEAAATYLDAVPADVAVGIVTFDSDVTEALAPTTDRAAATTVIDDLELSKDTLLFDGVIAAVDAAGSDGQRSVLVLSDGADTGADTTVDDVTAAIADADVLVDVVSMGQRGDALDVLAQMTDAGDGEVITASGDALAETFAAEADVLASQVLVTAPLPDGFAATEATIEVTLPTAGGDLVASAFATIAASSTPADETLTVPETTTPTGIEVPSWALYVGIGVLGLGLFMFAFLLVPGKPRPLSIADRVAAYSTATRRPSSESAPEAAAADPVLDQAKAAAQGLLERHSGLNNRLMRRLGAAGSEFKPSEWLLVHAGVVIVAVLLGLLVGMGNLIVGLVFVLLGLVAPPLYLSLKVSRRRKAFDDALPEVLQLLAGALSAGLSLNQAVDTVVNEGPEPIASEFKRVLVEARIGVPVEDAFEGVAERFQSKDFAWAVMAIRIQRQVGGNLAELLKTVAGTMRERQFLRRHVRALSAEGRLSAYILCALPVVFLLYLFLTNRDFLDPLVNDPRGWAISGFGVVWMAIGTFTMFRMVKVEL